MHITIQTCKENKMFKRKPKRSISSTEGCFPKFFTEGDDINICPGDFFMITNTKRSDYEVVYQCKGFDMENRILCENNEVLGIHFLHVAKAVLCNCTQNIEIGDHVTVCYNKRLPGFITRISFKGQVKDQIGRKQFIVEDYKGINIVVPKDSVFKIVEVIKQSNSYNGDRRSFTRGLRADLPA